MTEPTPHLLGGDPDRIGWFYIEQPEPTVLDAYFSKSFLGSWRMCPQRALAAKPDMHSAAMSRGTIAHLAAEWTFQTGEAPSRHDEMFWDSAMESQQDFDTRNADLASLVASAASMAKLFEGHHAPPTEVEVNRRRECGTVHINGMDVRVHVKGTPDCVWLTDAQTIIVDWKSGKPKPSWELERYGVDALVYAAMFDGPVRFNYAWIETGGVTAFVLDGAQCRQRVLLELAGVVRQILSDEPAPISPNGWWCSERWCEAHRNGECVGAHQTIYPEEKTVQITDTRKGQ